MPDFEVHSSADRHGIDPEFFMKLIVPFLASLAHSCNQFQIVEEYWGNDSF